MGRFVEYVVLLSNLSFILGTQQYIVPSQGSNHERQKPDNFTHAIKQYLHLPKDQNALFNQKLLPQGLLSRRRSLPPKPKQMLSTAGLNSFASDDPEWTSRKKNSSELNLKFLDVSRNAAPPFSQTLYPRRYPRYYSPAQKLAKLSNRDNSFSDQSKKPDNFYRRFQNQGRHARHYPRHSNKICDPCNSIPWIPLLKVPDSYRQQRTHVTELHPTPLQNLHFDYQGYASNTQNVLLPPVPLVPPLEPIYDGTISSSFGLPIGNIPTSHGLLAPLNHLPSSVNKYALNAIDFSNSFNYYSPHGLLENNNFPQLSPVPIVPIHDSAQFYKSVDSAIPDLVPPPTKAVDVSNVVLTISEEQHPTKLVPLNHKNSGSDLTSGSSALDFQASRSQGKDQNQSKDFGRLEIVKSIPLAEFTSTAHFPQRHQQQLPLYPPLQSEFSQEFHVQKSISSDHSISSLDFLVPPANNVEADVSFNSNISSDLRAPAKSELQEEASAPKPLTSPSLSWLFSDHTAPSGDSKSTASVSSFLTNTQEIASVVNNELRQVSSQPQPGSSPGEESVGGAKSKKIQIIIPYTTKNKKEHDNNALESVQHEMFQPPVSKSTFENNAPHDFAISGLPPATDKVHQPESNRDRKVIDENEDKEEHIEKDKEHKYLSEMRHIIASNIRELLKEEIEKSQRDQNYPLQNNIDNWTALEYSNHKTVETKAPKEIIAQALTVTSIPGNSISHLLLPSKKIPNEYFVTTPIPVYDEPNNYIYKAGNSTVNSRPFTAKPYATTNIYNPKNDLKEDIKKPSETNQPNHEKNYTEVGRGRVNTWGKLNENLVLPEERTRTRTTEQTTTSTWTTSFYSTSREKVQIVTPVSVTPQRNHTVTPFRRTTRQVRTSESPTESPTTVRPTRKVVSLSRLNSTKLENVSNLTTSFNRKFSYDSTTVQTGNSSESVSGVKKTKSTMLVVESGVKTNVTESSIGTTVRELPSSTEQISINDVFPFRNKELPWESSHNNSQPTLRIARQRKSLIKQVNIQRPKAEVGSS